MWSPPNEAAFSEAPSGGPMCGDARGTVGVPIGGRLPNGVFSDEQSLNGVAGLSRLVRFVWLFVGGV